ncbi:MAG: hypothetical protein R3B91_22425 [Planctomycetaceae bacterium]
MGDGVEGGQEARPKDNSRVQSAMISGVFGLLGTVATVFAVRTTPAPEPPPTTAVSTSPAAISPEQAMPAASLGAIIAPPQPAANLLLNFAAFQAQLATPDIDMEQRASMVRPLLNRTVIWKGYVDAIIPLTEPTADRAVTVSLVESQAKTQQSMFKTPAHFRFPIDELDAVNSLQVGDQVTLTGVLSNHSLIATEVLRAHIVSVNGQSSMPQTAKAPITPTR